MLLDIAPSEMLLTVIVAVVVIGPKDMPRALRTAGRWIGKMRRVSGHFRAGLENMIREAELEEMEQKWRAQNEAIMKASAAEAAAAPAALPAADTTGGSALLEAAGVPPVAEPVAAPLATPQAPEAPVSPSGHPATPAPNVSAPVTPADASGPAH